MADDGGAGEASGRRRAAARLVQLLLADGETFVSRPVPSLRLTLEGIAGDRHVGATRPSDVRTPWHVRGTPIANTRQLSIVSAEECAAIATLLDVPEVSATLLGANLVLAGMPELSLTMPGTRLQFPSGATVFVTEQNAPCRHPAGKLAEAFGRADLATAFTRAAIGRRGVVALVEREGEIACGDPVRVIASPARVERPAVPWVADG